MPSAHIISFIYLHGIHHLYHTAMTAIELSNLQNKYEVSLVSCSHEHTGLLINIQLLYANHNTIIKEILLPFRIKYLNIKNKSYPSLVSTVLKVVSFLKTVDGIVARSHSTVTLAKKYKITKPKLDYPTDLNDLLKRFMIMFQKGNDEV